MEHLEEDAAAEGSPKASPPVAPDLTPASPGAPERRGFRPLVWLGVALLVAAGVAIILPRERKAETIGSKGLAPGTVVDAELTLITSDRAEVACLSTRTVGQYACDFSSATDLRRLPERDILRPYMTGARQVYLVPGLFLEPHLEKRYQSEPPRDSRDQLRRFTARCKLKMVGRLEGFKLRWAAAGKWSDAQDADVATVLGCQIEG